MTNLFEILGRERSLGEIHGRLVHEHAREDPTLYAQGILRYAQARAAFDGLIEAARHQVIQRRDLDEIPGFELSVRSALDRARELSDLVQARVLENTEAARFDLGDLLKPGELVKAVIDGALGLLKELRTAAESRRQETLAQLDGLRWRPFEELMRE